ncbi:hypothetical protein CJF60_04610 [Mycoplasmopsis agassizii]|uniref:Uncharacterized protein n=2 Tax=Mycoplasmopsis agassizii TaxID=33922 RepID=A0ABX4H519_9BACT|nr:hypothetical protein CJF60_04610 [Mycoplasmopsis agassizii]
MNFLMSFQSSQIWILNTFLIISAILLLIPMIALFANFFIKFRKTKNYSVYFEFNWLSVYIFLNYLGIAMNSFTISIFSFICTLFLIAIIAFKLIKSKFKLNKFWLINIAIKSILFLIVIVLNFRFYDSSIYVFNQGHVFDFMLLIFIFILITVEYVFVDHKDLKELKIGKNNFVNYSAFLLIVPFWIFFLATNVFLTIFVSILNVTQTGTLLSSFDFRIYMYIFTSIMMSVLIYISFWKFNKFKYHLKEYDLVFSSKK